MYIKNIFKDKIFQLIVWIIKPVLVFIIIFIIGVVLQDYYYLSPVDRETIHFEKTMNKYSLSQEEKLFSLENVKSKINNDCPEDLFLEKDNYKKCLMNILLKKNDEFSGLYTNIVNSSKIINEEFKEQKIYDSDINKHKFLYDNFHSIFSKWIDLSKTECDLEIKNNPNIDIEIIARLCMVDKLDKYIDKLLQIRTEYVSNTLKENKNIIKTEDYKRLSEFENEYQNLLLK